MGENLKLSIKENEALWEFSIKSDKVSKLDMSELYLIRNIIAGIEGVYIETDKDKVLIGIDKNI